ncbi:hypothetical protein QA640_34660 [Bradyrhizobium sp. CB82]|uniref:hypothetical protein n=1 Tax=Bradyrhizobium sp. CB82 TaxID=3039159 RepID=UPI0024B0DBB7|nr:hypothetical protein [Bradyrhizobium sp. CB82]WFU39464.1 hypothetical protein QA640_34660 [Bradyrhizobium sp. CB82]
MPVFSIGLIGLFLRGTTGPVEPLRLEAGCRLAMSSETACPGPPLVQVASPSGWKFTRTQGTKDGESFAAIMKTADTVQSDLDFAGLIVRCAPKGKIDVLIALIRPFPPRSRPQVTIAAGGSSLTFEASMAGAGTAVLLPDEVSAFAAGKWQTTPSLAVSVKENDSEIKGVITLGGLREAYASLLASCSQ